MKPKPRSPAKEPMPWVLGEGLLEPADIFALQALDKGVANAGQQQRALDVILNKISRHSRMSFFPGGHEGDRATIFAEGKRFVGTQIARFLKMRPETPGREPSEPPTAAPSQ